MSLAAGSSHHQGLSLDLSVAASNGSTNASVLTEDHMSLARPRYDFHVNSSTCVNDSAVGNSQALPAVETIGSPLDEMMTAAYGDKLLYCDGGPHDSEWCQHWSVIIQRGTAVKNFYIHFCYISIKHY